MTRLRPRHIQPGDLLAVVAPSGPVPAPRFAAGMALLAERYRLRTLGVERAAGFLAGSDEERLADLNAALRDPEVRGVLCARGGYGAMRLLPRLDPSLLTHDPKPLVGFSDVTVLHAAWLRAGLPSVHGPVITQLGQLTDPRGTLAELAALLESPSPPPPWMGLTGISPGSATGPAVGGNLEMLTRLLGTPFLPPLDGAVLFLEEVGERPYKLDRQLTHLRLAGVLARVAAVVVGDLVGCDDPEGAERARRGAEVVAEQLAGLGVPVVAGAPFGHGARNRPFVHGGRVRVEAEAAAPASAGGGAVHFLEGAVS